MSLVYSRREIKTHMILNCFQDVLELNDRLLFLDSF